MRGRLGLVALLLLTAGCIGAGENATEDVGATDARDENDLSGEAPDEQGQAPGDDAAGDPTFEEGAGDQAPRSTVRSWTWNTTELAGDAALRVALSFPEQTECEMQAGTAGVSQGYGPRAVFLKTEDGAFAGMAGGGSYPYPAHAHAGPVDTREVTAPEGKSAGRSTSQGSQGPGTMNLTLLGHGLEAWENDLTDGASAFLNVTCEDPFRVLGTWAGADLLLFDETSLEGGAGANVAALLAGATASLADEASFQTAEDRVEVHATGFDFAGASLTELTVQGPEVDEAWRFQTTPAEPWFYEGVSGGPGQYDLRLTRADGGAANAFIGAVFGLSPVESLEAFGGGQTVVS